MRKSETPTPEVDDEGYSKQPSHSGTANDPWSDMNQSKAFDSSSDDSGKYKRDLIHLRGLIKLTVCNHR